MGVARNRNLKDAFLIGHNYRCEWTAVLLRLTTLKAFRERTSRTFFFASTFYTRNSTRRHNVTEKALGECTEITVTGRVHNTERILQVEKSRRRWLRRPRILQGYGREKTSGVWTRTSTTATRGWWNYLAPRATNQNYKDAGFITWQLY